MQQTKTTLLTLYPNNNTTFKQAKQQTNHTKHQNIHASNPNSQNTN